MNPIYAPRRRNDIIVRWLCVGAEDASQERNVSALVSADDVRELPPIAMQRERVRRPGVEIRLKLLISERKVEHLGVLTGKRRRARHRRKPANEDSGRGQAGRRRQAVDVTPTVAANTVVST